MAAPQDLIEASLEARNQAYAKYSQFQVGAALRTAGGDIIRGCNVENASYGLTNCAERTAVFTAVARGERQFTEIAVASTGGVMPCGACLQVLAEFCPRLNVYLVDAETRQIAEMTLDDLLPRRFRLEN